MRGFPNNLQTRVDYEYVIANFDKSLQAPKLQQLLETAYNWMYVRKLEDSETQYDNDTDYKIVDPQPDDQDQRRSLFHWEINPYCKLNQLGFTQLEIQQLLSK